jgi:hypothetical protein
MQMVRDIATCMYYTGIERSLKEKVFVARHLRDRNLKRGFPICFPPETGRRLRRVREVETVAPYEWGGAFYASSSWL